MAAALLRPILLAPALFLALLWSGKPITKAEWQLAAVLGILVAALLVPSLLATDPSRGLKEWIKLILISVYCLALARALRDRASARIYAIGLVVAACVTGALLLTTYVDHAGFAILTYKQLRTYKGVATNSGVLVNPAAFSCLFCFICAMCILPATRLLWLIGLALLAIGTFLTGSRMPPGVTLGAAILLIAIAGFRSRKLPLRVIMWMGAVVVTGALTVTLYIASGEAIFRTTMSTGVRRPLGCLVSGHRQIRGTPHLRLWIRFLAGRSGVAASR